MSESLLAWVEAIKPDLIYTQLASLSLMRLVNGLVRASGTPLVIHFMDDWPSTIFRGGITAPLLRRTLRAELDQLLQRACLLLAISDDMAEQFEARYALRFTAFHNALNLASWTPVQSELEDPEDLEVLYTGRIGTANKNSLLDVARAVSRMASEGQRIHLTIVSPDCTHRVAVPFRQFEAVTLDPPIPHSEIPARLAAADLLVLPLDFGRQASRFARFSMPTKTVEYMASGTPIIVYAPLENAVARYAADAGWGWVVGRRSQGELKSVLQRLVEDQTTRERLGGRPALACRNHDAQAIQERFRSTLASATLRGNQTCRESTEASVDHGEEVL